MSSLCHFLKMYSKMLLLYSVTQNPLTGAVLGNLAYNSWLVCWFYIMYTLAVLFNALSFFSLVFIWF